MADDKYFIFIFILIAMLGALVLKEIWDGLIGPWLRKLRQAKAIAQTGQTILASERAVSKLDAHILQFGVSAHRIAETFEGLRQSLYDSDEEELEVLNKALAWAEEQEDYESCVRFRDRIAELIVPHSMKS